MIHRRILVDDNRGVEEALNEKQRNGSEGLVQKVRHFLVFDSKESFTTHARSMQSNFDSQPLIFISKSNTSQFTASSVQQI